VPWLRTWYRHLKTNQASSRGTQHLRCRIVNAAGFLFCLVRFTTMMTISIYTIPVKAEVAVAYFFVFALRVIYCFFAAA
jgi:hypothetical protein